MDIILRPTCHLPHPLKPSGWPRMAALATEHRNSGSVTVKAHCEMMLVVLWPEKEETQREEMQQKGKAEDKSR